MIKLKVNYDKNTGIFGGRGTVEMELETETIEEMKELIKVFSETEISFT